MCFFISILSVKVQYTYAYAYVQCAMYNVHFTFLRFNLLFGLKHFLTSFKDRQHNRSGREAVKGVRHQNKVYAKEVGL